MSKPSLSPEPSSQRPSLGSSIGAATNTTAAASQRPAGSRSASQVLPQPGQSSSLLLPCGPSSNSPPAAATQQQQQQMQRQRPAATPVDKPGALPPTLSTPQKVTVPPVPANSWYARPFTEQSHQPVSEYHALHKGRVVFATKAVPVRQAELDLLPGRGPQPAQFFELGKDLIYGMSYLHNTALYTEYRWRGRVSHLQAVKEGRAEIPESIRKAREMRKVYAEAAARKKEKTKPVVKDSTGLLPSSPSPPSSSPSASASPHANCMTADGIMSMDRAEPTIYQHPFFDMLLGIKVYVNDELVADHYPGVKSLPQCSATIDATEAVNQWNCVPFVLMGYQNHVTLDTIDLYRKLSLSFVEHLLHLKFPQITAAPSPSAASAAAAASVDERLLSLSKSQTVKTEETLASRNDEKQKQNQRSSNSTASRKLSISLPAVAPGTRVMEMRLRVEIVYGCRAEAFYCTDFIARGSCTLFMPETAKTALKSYEEKLRALILARRSSEQIIRAPSPVSQSKPGAAGGGAQRPTRMCQVCGNPLLFCCTVCGADYCGSFVCSQRPLRGYPCGCSAHKAMLI